MVKSAKKAAKKPQPKPNAEAVAKYEAERAAGERFKMGRPPIPYGTKRSPAVEAAFLAGLSKGYSVTASANNVGIDRSTAFAWRQNSQRSLDKETGIYADDFCVRWDDATEQGVDLLEDEAIRRASKGVERPVYQGGVMVGTTTEYSDTLMGLVLRGKRPGRYNTERHEHTGKDGGAIAHSMQVEFIDGDDEE